MQDPSTAFQPMRPNWPEQEQLKCPRCDSTKTKFCYYNNYNLSQPRHFCKNCRRYWTKGGTLRNIPVGGGSRKNTKRSSNQKRANSDPNPNPNTNTDPARLNCRVPESSSLTTTTQATSSSQILANGISDLGDPTHIYGFEADQEGKIQDMSCSFSSLLAPNVQFGSIYEGMNPNGSGLKMVQMGGFGDDLNAGSGEAPGFDEQGSDINNEGEVGSYLQSSDWGNSNGWPDLAIYTPGSSFQ
ncbi:dof zinc finger protein DOF3.1 [Manihot esculenta]|uniref:Dof zinc finger protein n=1 Tax=Manihot esculenta TaxID=3983 RepID=A0A2C9UZC6_MANES|nr:dof zinc finger protein DOF3.1 [Manihot esculenta]OAY36536.1 hypothetical protein MANES_11G028600v8 [Manihot esculenta]